MAFVKTWDETKPAGARSASLGDDDIREFKYAIRERLAVDHKFVDDETGVTTVGYHLKCTLIESAADPSNVANTGILYTKDSGGITELYYIDSAGTIKQLTSNGKLNITNAEVAGIISGAAQGDIIYLSGATTLTRLAKDANAERVLCNTGANNNPQWDLVNLTNAVEGVLAIVNGGTGGATAAAARIALGLAIGTDVQAYSALNARIKTGTYTGDGGNTQAITGVGFQGKEVRIADLTNDRDGWKNDQMGAAAVTRGASGACYTGANHIPSIDADGFTVGDGDAQGNMMNNNGVTYYYTVLG